MRNYFSARVSPPKLGGVAARSADGVVPEPKRFKNAFSKCLGFGTTPSVLRTATPPNLGGDTLAEKLRRVLIPALLLSLLLTVVIIAQKKPEITVAPASVKFGGLVMLNGTGFTPDRPVLSHLLRPNGTEYNPLRLRANARGELVHKIDTVMLDIGTFEVWIEDEDAKVVSNRVKFNVVP